MVYSKISEFFKKNSSIRNISMIAGGTAIAQGINILSTPILSRMYSPEDFGIAAVFISVVSILSVIASLRYELAIPLPKSDRYADAAVLLSFSIQFTFVIVLAILAYCITDEFMRQIKLDEIIPYKMLIPIGVLGTSIYIILTQWAIRRGTFTAIGKTKITQVTTGVATKLLIGLYNASPFGLLLGEIISKAGGSITLLNTIIKEKGFPKWNRQDIKRVAIKYKNFPLFDIWTAIFNVAGYQLIPYLVLIYYDTKTTGYFAMANNLMMLPGALIGTAIGQVFLQKASTAYHCGTLKEVTLKTYRSLLMVGIYPGLFLSLLAPNLFSFVLGSEWREAGIFAMIMGPWVVAMFVQSPLSNVLSILGKQKQAMYIEITYSVSRLAAFVLGTIWKDVKISIFLLMLVGLILTMFRLWYLLYVVGIDKDLFKYFTYYLAEALLLLTIPMILFIINYNTLTILVIMILSLVLFTYVRYIDFVKHNSVMN